MAEAKVCRTRNDLILQLFADQVSPEEISRRVHDEFGSYLCRNALNAVVNRAKVKGDERATRTVKKKRGREASPMFNPSAPRKPRPPVVLASVPLPPQIQSAIPLSATTTRFQCRFPLNDDMSNLLVCACRCERPPYCNFHRAIAFTAKPR
jgi:hypothetical protein